MSGIVDDKSQYCIPFILERLEVHHRRYANVENAPPFFLGLNGVQGAGKTVLSFAPEDIEECDLPAQYQACKVSIIENTLRQPPYNLPTVVFSLDDLYLTHADQVSLANSYPDNPLLQHRGQPSTHDVRLAKSIFDSLRQNAPTDIPFYDKAAYDGQGDRAPRNKWQKVNLPGQSIVKVVLFEGWAVGFCPLSERDLKHKWEHAVKALQEGRYVGRLAHNTLENVAAINHALQEYNHITDQLDALIHIDAMDPQYVYKWREEQESGLRASKGAGMTSDQVKSFIDGYYPAYELFTDTLRAGIFGLDKGRQLRLVVDEHRKVKEVLII